MSPKNDPEEKVYLTLGEFLESCGDDTDTDDETQKREAANLLLRVRQKTKRGKQPCVPVKRASRARKEPAPIKCPFDYKEQIFCWAPSKYYKKIITVCNNFLEGNCNKQRKGNEPHVGLQHRQFTAFMIGSCWELTQSQWNKLTELVVAASGEKQEGKTPADISVWTSAFLEQFFQNIGMMVSHIETPTWTKKVQYDRKMWNENAWSIQSICSTSSPKDPKPHVTIESPWGI